MSDLAERPLSTVSCTLNSVSRGNYRLRIFLFFFRVAVARSRFAPRILPGWKAQRVRLGLAHQGCGAIPAPDSPASRHGSDAGQSISFEFPPLVLQHQ